MTFSLCPGVLNLGIHGDKSVNLRTSPLMQPLPINITVIAQYIFTVKKHHTVPRNQVAVDIFVREVNCCCDIIQELEGGNNVKFSYVKKSYVIISSHLFSDITFFLT